MKEVARFEDIRTQEKESREQQRLLLESLSGFSRLSPRQKRYLTTSFYIQQRAERGTDSTSAERIREMPEEFKKFLGVSHSTYIAYPDSPARSNQKEPRGEKQTDKYFKSQLRIMNDFCHDAIAKLEDYRDGELRDSLWVDAGPVTSFSDVEELVILALEQDNFPLVVQIWEGRKEENNLTNLLHSMLLLGKDDRGEYIVWEKSGWHMPFRLVSLKEVYESYGYASGWVMRPLSV